SRISAPPHGPCAGPGAAAWRNRTSSARYRRSCLGTPALRGLSMLLRLRLLVSLMLAGGWLAACGNTQSRLPEGAGGGNQMQSEYNTEASHGGGQGQLFSEQGLTLGVGKGA